MLFKRVVLTLVMLLAFATVAFAQDPNKVVVDKSMLTPDQLAKVQTNQTIEQVKQVGQFAGLGKEIGEGVNGALSAITDNANKFANTKAGEYTMWMVAFKILGKDAIRLGLSLLFAAVFTVVFVWMYSRNAIPRRMLIEQTGKDRKWEYIRADSDAQVFYSVAYAVLMLIALAVGGC